MKGEKEIPTSTVRSLWYQGMLMDIVYVVSNGGHFGSMSSERESVCLVELLRLSIGGG